jgi:hypothetical protein
MKTITQLGILFAGVAFAVLIPPSCHLSPREIIPGLEAQKQQWAAQMSEAFPERTSDTTELKRRLDHFRETRRWKSVRRVI